MDFSWLAAVPLLGQVGSRLRVSDLVTSEEFVKVGVWDSSRLNASKPSTRSRQGVRVLMVMLFVRQL